ncbi:MAG: RNA-binding cell elongation regulator Jag/EloR [Chloroflexia bacterium]
MKQAVTIRAQTVQEAIRLALEHLQLPREAVEVEVLEEPDATAGVEEALVRVVPKGDAGPQAPAPAGESDPFQTGLELLSELLRRMGFRAQVTIGEYTVAPGETHRVLDVTTTNERDSGLLIGRRGETLQQLQFLVNLMVSRRIQRWPSLIVDVEFYRRRRHMTLQELATRMAERVCQTHQPITLEPMPAYERRIIHLALRENPRVITQSTGQGDSRKVVIYPAGWQVPPNSSS